MTLSLHMKKASSAMTVEMWERLYDNKWPEHTHALHYKYVPAEVSASLHNNSTAQRVQ